MTEYCGPKNSVALGAICADPLSGDVLQTASVALGLALASVFPSSIVFAKASLAGKILDVLRSRYCKGVFSTGIAIHLSCASTM